MVHARQRGVIFNSTWIVFIDDCEVGRCCKQASNRLGMGSNIALQSGIMWRHFYDESLVILLLAPPHPTPTNRPTTLRTCYAAEQRKVYYTWRDCRFDFSLTSIWLLSQQPAKCIVTDEARKLSSRYLFGCCSTMGAVIDGNAATMGWMSREKPKALGDKKVLFLNNQL